MTVDDVLKKYAAYCDSTNREIEYDTSDNIDFDEAKQQLRTIMETVIGQDEIKETARPGYDHAQNDLRAEQRQRLDELFGKEPTDDN